MVCDYNGVVVEWTAKEAAKIAEIKGRSDRPRKHEKNGTGNAEYNRFLRDLWHYYDYFFHPEAGYVDNKWEVVHDNP